MHNRTMHIALIKVSPNKEAALIPHIERTYTEFLSRLKDSEYTEQDKLYVPRMFHILGNYDLAFISLIDNFSFAQKPMYIIDDKLGHIPFKHQTITGILNPQSELDFYTEYSNFNFTAITHIKLCNKFIINNGSKFIDAVVGQIYQIIKNDYQDKIKAYVLRSFSWFDLNLVLLGNDLQDLSDLILIIRESKLMHMSRFHDFIGNNVCNHNTYFKSSPIVSETISYIGISQHCLSSGEIPKNDNINFSLEWQIRPGHLETLHDRLKDFDDGRHELISKFGKSDFRTKTKNYTDLKSFFDSYPLFSTDSQSTDDSKSNFLQNALTDLQIPIPLKVIKKQAIDSIVGDNDGSIQPSPGFRKTMFPIKPNLNQINKNLKSLNVSDHLRNKIIKTFTNYMTYSSDGVLASYLYDIRDSMLDIEEFISHKAERILAPGDKHSMTEKNVVGLSANRPHILSTSEFERVLSELIKLCEEAINIRTLNSYSFEDISDINIDFNSSIQQLLTVYNCAAKATSEIIYEKRLDYIVVLGNTGTRGNVKYISYNVYDFLHPEFILSTLNKEVLNGLKLRSDIFSQEIENLEKYVSTYLWPGSFIWNNDLLVNFHKSKIWDTHYLIADIMRFTITCNSDPSLFVYWSWCITLKNSAVYEIGGPVSDLEIMAQVFRIAFTLKVHELDPRNIMTCPIVDIKYSWRKIFNKVIDDLDNLFSDTEFKRNYIDKLYAISLDRIYRMYKTNIPVPEDYDHNSSSFYASLLNTNNNRNVEYKKYHQITPQVLYRYDLVHNYFKKVTKNGSLFLPTEANASFAYELVTYAYLKRIHDLNMVDGPYINYLSKKWHSGDVRRPHESEEMQSPLYFVTRTGSVYFTNKTSAAKYFQERNNCLTILWDLSERYKNHCVQYDKYVSKQSKRKPSYL